jgi:hypothetical protein
MRPPLAALSVADVLGLLVAAAVCAFLLYALLRGENL